MSYATFLAAEAAELTGNYAQILVVLISHLVNFDDHVLSDFGIFLAMNVYRLIIIITSVQKQYFTTFLF